MKKYIIISIIGFISVTLVCWYLFWNWLTPEQLTMFSQFYSGSVGVIVTLIFAVIAYRTYINQQQTFEHQQQTTQRQNFESTFFRFLDIRSDIIRNMRLIVSRYEPIDPEEGFFFGAVKQVDDVFEGQDVFDGLCLNMSDVCIEQLDKIAKDKDSLTEDELILKVHKALQDAFIEIQKRCDVSPYMRHMYYVLNYVNEQSYLSESEKRFYVDMIRTQITRGELLFLFYGCLSERGMKTFKPLLEKFGFLSGIPNLKNAVMGIEICDYTTLFNPSAFNR